MCRRGQSTLEYVVLVAVVIAALLAMRVYMKRGVSGKLKSSTDSIGAQYSPTEVTADWKISSSSVRQEQSTSTGVSTTTNVVQDENQTKSGSETLTIDPAKKSLF